MFKRIFTVNIIVVAIFWSIGLVSFVPSAQASTISSGDLIKASTSAVYYYGADGKRYVFPNERTYKTWYVDFTGVKTITDVELANIQITGNVTYKPGVKMVKITTDSKVYAVAANGILRWVTTEILAATLYGASWQTLIEDIPDPFFVNYTVGSPINNVSDYNPAATTAASVSINTDKSLIVPTAVPNLTISLASDTPAAGISPAGSAVNFTKIIFSASNAPVSIKSIYVKRFGLSSNSDVINIKFVKINNEIIGNVAELNANSKALISFNPALVINANSQLNLFIRANISDSTQSGNTIGLGIEAASDIELVSGTALGNFPVIGNYQGKSPSESNLGALTLPEGVLIAGRQKQGVASFKVTAGAGEDMYLNSIIVTDTGTGKIATNWYLYSSQRNDGISISQPVASAIMDSVTKKAKFILPTNSVMVLASQSVTLTVAIDAALVDGTTVKNGDTLQAIIANGTDIVATGKASGAQINGSAVTNSDIYYVLASWPYFNLDTASPKGVFVPGIRTLLAIFDVTADIADEVDFLNAATNSTGLANKLTVNIAHSCTAGVGSGFELVDESGIVLDSNAVDVCNNNSVTFTFGNPNNFTIAPGATKKLYIYADTRGATNNGNSIQLYLDSSNADNVDFAIDGSGNNQFAQYVFRNNLYANPLAR